jgi:ABC-type Mn2+/Zn2+ transport system ATPase subunit
MNKSAAITSRENLSGGNQQKVVLANMAARMSQRLRPRRGRRRGIDVGAKTKSTRSSTTSSRRGAGVLVISSEIEELTRYLRRILVMNRGRACGMKSRARIFDPSASSRCTAQQSRPRRTRPRPHHRLMVRPAQPRPARALRLVLAVLAFFRRSFSRAEPHEHWRAGFFQPRSSPSA